MHKIPVSTHLLHLNNSAYESIITNIRSLHLNVSVRLHNHHSLISSHENWIVVGSWRNLNLTLTLTAEQNIWIFQYLDKNCTEQKSRNLEVSIIFLLAQNSIKRSDTLQDVNASRKSEVFEMNIVELIR